MEGSCGLSGDQVNWLTGLCVIASDGLLKWVGSKLWRKTGIVPWSLANN